MRHVIGGARLPASGAAIVDVVADDGALTLTCDDGTRLTVPFDTAFLA